MAGVLGLLTAVEISFQDWGNGGVKVGAEAEEEKVPVKCVGCRSMEV